MAIEEQPDDAELAAYVGTILGVDALVAKTNTMSTMPSMRAVQTFDDEVPEIPMPAVRIGETPPDAGRYSLIGESQRRR
jgi:hypothetical protein